MYFMKRHTYHIITIGCQMNKSDSERIAGYLEGLGFAWTNKREKAEVVIVTTCGVRQSAEDRVYGILPKIKKANPKVKIVLTGCLAGRADVQKRLKDSVDIWLPITELAGLEKRLSAFVISNGAKRNEKSLSKSMKMTKRDSSPASRNDNKKRTRDDNKGSVGGYLKINPKYESPISAYVPIGNGCNNFCAYCVVPYARGREVYRPASEIIKEVKNLVKRGYKEITLIAQNVNSYKSANSNQRTVISKQKIINFSELLRMVSAIPRDFWIRFATSHPKDMSEELIETIAECDKVCRQIHLPAQAGDNKVLAKMNRKYTREHYLALIKKIRKVLPDVHPVKSGRAGARDSELFNRASISTDVIVGFPGETKTQFKNTEKLFREARFDMAYTAQYSPRPGTAASKLKDDVPKAEKKRREEVLLKILKQTALANNKKYVGKTVETLVDGRRGEVYFGKTKSGKNVRIGNGGRNLLGRFIKVKINSVKEFGLAGDYVK